MKAYHIFKTFSPDSAVAIGPANQERPFFKKKKKKKRKEKQTRFLVKCRLGSQGGDMEILALPG